MVLRSATPATPATPTALWVLPVGAMAGVGRHAVDVASVGIPGWRTVFLTPEGPVVDELRRRGADAVMVAPFGPDHGLASSVRALRAALRRFRPQLVHSHLSYADVVTALVAPRGTTVVSTEHGLADDDLVYHGSRGRARAKARLHRTRFRRTDALIAVSEATLRVARSKWHVPGRVLQRVVHNGVDAVSAAPRPGLHVVSLARLAPEKRLADLLRGFALMAAGSPEARLTLAGIGPEEATLRGLVRDLGLSDRVDLPGFVDPAALLGSAHVLGQLSIWENCSYSLLDAVSHGLGVVASPVGGNPEILPARCLVEPGDSEAVARLLCAQGRDLAERPRLDGGWPSVAQMTTAVAEVYEATR